MAVKTKALAPERNAAVRALVRAIVKDEFGGNQSSASRTFGVSQSMLHEFLADPPKRGAGVKLLAGVSSYLGWSLDEVIKGERSPSRPAHPNRSEDKVERTYSFALEVLGVSEDAIRLAREHQAKFGSMAPEDLLDFVRLQDRILARRQVPRECSGVVPSLDVGAPIDPTDPYPSRQEALRRLRGRVSRSTIDRLRGLQVHDQRVDDVQFWLDVLAAIEAGVPIADVSDGS